jgi:chromosome segregation ATPase
LLEISGFFLVAYELFRTQRREFGDPKALRLLNASRARVRGFFRRLLRRPTQVTDLAADLSGSATLTGTLKAQLRRGRGETLEDHVAALEENFALLDKEVEEHRVELDKSIAELREELRETRAEFERQRQEREEEEKDLLRASVSLQWWGIGLFVVGTIFSGIANVVSCS